MGTLVPGCSCWGAHAGDTHVGVFTLGCLCWSAHNEILMLGCPCWDACFGVPILGCSCWGADIGMLMLGCPRCGVHIGISLWGARVGVLVLGGNRVGGAHFGMLTECSCWDAHAGVLMLGCSRWGTHIWMLMLGCSHWGPLYWGAYVGVLTECSCWGAHVGVFMGQGLLSARTELEGGEEALLALRGSGLDPTLQPPAPAGVPHLHLRAAHTHPAPHPQSCTPNPTGPPYPCIFKAGGETPNYAAFPESPSPSERTNRLGVLLCQLPVLTDPARRAEPPS